jgi:ribosome-associated protein
MSAMPTSADYVEVNRRVRVPLSGLRFAFSRSSGPGGQNVNKVSTRVTLLFDVSATTALTPRQRARVMEGLGTRINSEGVLRVVSSRHRSQAANRQAATERFVALLAEALAVPKPRIETRVPRAVVARRLREKARRSEAKRLRRQRPSYDD